MPTKAPAAILGVGLNCPMVICFDSEIGPRIGYRFLSLKILKISTAYTPRPSEGFISPMTWGTGDRWQAVPVAGAHYSPGTSAEYMIPVNLDVPTIDVTFFDDLDPSSTRSEAAP